MKRKMAFLTALVMTGLSMPLSSVSAASVYEQGDVDQDGLVTGHDAAMVSMYADGKCKLTEQQQFCGDVNADGAVDAVDAAMIYENQEYPLGDVDQDGDFDLTDAILVKELYVAYKADPSAADCTEWIWADVNCDGVVNIEDKNLIACTYAKQGAMMPLFEDGKYYYSYDIECVYDVDYDRKVTLADANCIAQIYAANSCGAKLSMELVLAKTAADVNWDGVIDLEDMTIVLTAYAQKGAGIV